VAVENFTDSKGRASARGMLMAKEFKKQFAVMKLNVMSSGTGAVVGGTLTPFREKEKWQIKVEVVSAETGAVITAYTGILKKIKRVKK